MEYNLWQRFLLWLGCTISVGIRTKPGWKGSNPFYAWKCKTCGEIAEDYPHGYRMRLECNHCKASTQDGEVPLD